MLPGGPLLPLSPPLAGMPAIAYLEPYRMIFVHSIREIFVCSLRKTFGHLSDRTKKIEIDKALTLEHHTCNKVFVSREAEPELLADPSVVRAEPDHVPISFLRQIPGVEDRHPARSHKDPAWFPQLPRKNRYRPPGR
jgi:hypothetical protein